MYKTSFVVDGSASHYYQAELLLLSLEQFAQFNRADILVQCTSRTDEAFLSFLEKNGYQYRLIKPFLDGKYCNKIRQLEAFTGEETPEGVFLLDTDTFALEPLAPFRSDCFCAKIVDAPNPSLADLSHIFEAAQLEPGESCPTDWASGGLTLSSNFNGGYYYVPGQHIAPLSEAWKKWATWLHARPELFGNRAYAIHTDQVAMALALTDLGIPRQSVASNYNCPTHAAHALTYFQPEQAISLLHYHGEINVFGLLNQPLGAHPSIEKAIAKANAAIAERAEFHFYEGFRRGLVRPVQRSEKTLRLADALGQMAMGQPKKLRLMLHGGTLKTGSTSLQFFMHQNRENLLRAGFLYPELFLATSAPKHQWLMRALITADEQYLIQHFSEVFAQVQPQTHTILLSNPAVYNHWNDFSQEAKSFLSVLAEVFDFDCWVLFREPLRYMSSLYRQFLKNPQTEVPCYGRDQSVAEMIRDRWFIEHLDYLGYICELEAIVGKEKLEVAKYNGDTVPLAKAKLGLDYEFKERERENLSLSPSAIELLRIVNRFPLEREEKDECIRHLYEIDKVITRHPQPNAELDAAQEVFRQLHALQKVVLRSSYQLEF